MTTVTDRRTPHADSSLEFDCFQLSVFRTRLGWFSLQGADGRLLGVRIGLPDRETALSAAAQEIEPHFKDIQVTDWCAPLRERLQSYAAGERIVFADVELTYRRELTGFQRRVVAATRSIPHGKTRSYKELADAAGSPQAARAVGNIMASNPFPIIVPCHRVVGSGGHLGGFTAPGGLNLKQKMLQLEARCSPGRFRVT